MKIIGTIILATLLLNLLGCSSIKIINNESNNFYGLSQEQYEFVKKETTPDGKLDFEKQFEANRLILIDNVAYNQKAASLYTWALEMKKLGIKNESDAINFYEELLNVELRESQKNAMKNAYAK